MIKLGGDQRGILDAQTAVSLLFIVALIGGCFWYVSQHRLDNKNTTPNKNKLVTPTYKNDNNELNDLSPQRYHDEDGRFTISYPGDWQINPSHAGSGNQIANTTVLVSPSGNTKLYLDYRGSYLVPDCIPDYYDVPFAATNRCFSAEYLTADTVPVTADTNWYLSRYHFKTITINAKELYATCVVGQKPALNQPKMGFFEDHPISPVNGNQQGFLSACVEAGSDIADFKKSEVQAGETILRSLRFD